jgi:hypothetical protein
MDVFVSNTASTLDGGGRFGRNPRTVAVINEPI